VTDQEARTRIETSLAESLLVEAAAGTGKTTMLVARIVETLRRGEATVAEIVAVTFTRKAAGELKLRLRQELDRERTATPAGVERDRLEQAIALLEEARIGTIHSFCAELLRERPVEAGIDPDFQEMADDEAPRLYERAFRAWIEHALERMPKGLERALSRLGTRPNYKESPLDRLRDAGYKLVEWRDFPTPWRTEPIELPVVIDTIVTEVFALAGIAAEASNPRDGLRRALEPVEALATWIRRAESEAGQARDYHTLEARLVDLRRELAKTAKRKGQGKTFAGRPRGEVLAARTALLAHLEEFERLADADLAALLREELSEVIRDYERLKRRAGKLDFVDLLLVARDLVRDRKDVRSHLQRRFRRIFVDEFQDTDPLQAELLLLLAADDPDVSDWRDASPVAGKLFLVGDPKQSIYRFRRADVMLYQEIRTQLEQAGVVTLHLNVSFRAVAPLQQAVNAAFAPEMTGDRAAGQSEYVPLAEEAPRYDAQPALIALPVPRPYGRYRPEIHGMAIEESLPDAVGAYIHWLVARSEWTVRDPDDPSNRVPIRPRHICILFRRFTSWWSDVTREYVRSLEARDVPHLLVGARSFHRREEVETLRAALTAVEWPDDELMVFATLRGSLFAIGDDLLLRFRKRSGSLHPFRPLVDIPVEFAAIVEALELLAELHRRRNRVPIVETLGKLLDTTRAHAGFALRPAGHQVLANVQRVGDLARSYEMRGGLSFRGFVEQLTAEADKRSSSEAPIPEEGAEGVRIMTVHTAKGLEFPIVILADPTCRLARETPDRFIDQERRLHATTLINCAPWDLLDHQDLERRRDAAEGVRIAYVAATRARDMLVVPAVGDGPYSGWLAPLNRAIYPPHESWRNARPGPGCPPFGTSSVLERHRDLEGMADRSVQPGLHRAETSDHEVTWWDPKRLRLDAHHNFGLQHEPVLIEDEDGAAARQSVDEWERWRDRREQTLVMGESPEHTILTPTEAEDDPPPPQPRVDLLATTARSGRPSGPRFGTLVHTVLRDVDLDARGDAVRRLAELHGRILDAPTAEIDAATEAVDAALEHDLVGRARAAERCHREAPFAVALDDGRAIEGSIDLVYLDDDGWVVVDFKTDANIGDRRAAYERQVSWYVHAVRSITGRAARGVLLHV